MSGANGADQVFSEADQARQLAFLRTVREDFHRVYYANNVKGGTWLGVPVWKCPLDLWIYQEIVWELIPDLIIETGSAYGGSALYLATVADLLQLPTKIVSIDINPLPVPVDHPRITWITGSSTEPETVAKVRGLAAGLQRVMVILDSDHSEDHVLQELELYGPLVTLGRHLIVEDTNVNGHPVYPEHGPGPWEAVGAFLARHDGEFAIDVRRERFLLSFNPGGYLVRVG